MSFLRRLTLDDGSRTAWAAAFARSAAPLLESTDYGRLQRGFAYARNGAVHDVSADFGALYCDVEGSRDSWYSVRVRVPMFGEDARAAWAHLMGPLGYSGDIAEGRFTGELLEQADALGCSPVPRTRELGCSCTCPDGAGICKHVVAALCAFTEEIDHSGEILLRARGIGAETPSRAMNVQHAGRTRWNAVAYEDGPTAVEAFSRTLGTLPDPVRAPVEADPPCFHRGPFDAGRFTDRIDADGLDLQAAFAAASAFDVLSTVEEGAQLHVRPDQVSLDAVRLAQYDSESHVPLAELAGCTPEEIEVRSLAWELGGPNAVDVCTGQWQPDAAASASADARLKSEFGTVTRTGNRWTVAAAGCQFRLGRDGRWYVFAKAAQDWWPVQAADDLDEAVASAQAAGGPDEAVVHVRTAGG